MVDVIHVHEVYTLKSVAMESRVTEHASENNAAAFVSRFYFLNLNPQSLTSIVLNKRNYFFIVSERVTGCFPYLKKCERSFD